jgi:hypothetical protein
MSLRDKILGTPEDRAELKAARADLTRIADRDREESDDFVAANDRVIDAEQNVPWTGR